MTTRDGDFDPKVKAMIALKAGFQCSYPGCSVLTGIPRGMLAAELKKLENLDEYRETLLVGEVAHINGQGDNSARADASLLQEYICSEENGIWLCANHHRMIDALRTTYGVEVIKEWKSQQEKMVATVSEKVAKHEEPEMYLDEPTLNKMQFNKSVNAGKIILALENDEDYRDQEKTFFNKRTFLSELNNYFEKWTTVPYRARKLAAVALVRIICDEGESCEKDPLWLRVVRHNEAVTCPIMLVYEAIREIKPTGTSSDGSLQKMLDKSEFFALVDNMISLDGSRVAWLGYDEKVFIDNDLFVSTIIFESELDGYKGHSPNVWELIRYVYKMFFPNNPEQLINCLIVHGNASILDVIE